MSIEIKYIEKPWGYEKIWAHTDKYVGKILFIRKGHQLSLQKHLIKEETIMVKKGILHFLLEGNTIVMSEGDVVHVKPGQVHRMRAVESDVEVVEVSTPELNDVVRLEDDYGR
jgi:quercetin dioxygenase-like cupin family protein